MKQLFRFFAVLLVTVFATVSWAQVNPLDCAVPLTIDAEVYIYNVGTGKFISKGEAWGSQAIVSDKPMLYKVQHPEGLADGVYVLYSDETGKSNKFMGRCNSDGQMGSGNRGMFVDYALADRSYVAFAEVTGGYYTIKPAADAPEEMDPNWCYGVNTAHASNQAKDGVTWGIWYDCTRADDGDNCLWAFVSPVRLKAAELNQLIAEAQQKGVAADKIAEAQAALNDAARTVVSLQAAYDTLKLAADIMTASPDAPAQMLVNGDCYANINGWTCYDSNGNTGDNIKPNAFDLGNQCAEFWNRGGYSLAQTVTNLPAGVYNFKAIAMTLTGMQGFIHLKKNGELLKELPIATVSRSVVNNRTQAAAWFSAGNGVHDFLFELEEPAAIEVSLTADNTTGDHWTVWRYLHLDYYGQGTATWMQLAQRALPEDWQNWRDNYAGQYAKQYFEALRAAHNMIDAATTGEAAKAAYYQAAAAVEAFNKNVELVTKLQDNIAALNEQHTALGEDRAGDPSVDPCAALLETANTWIDAIDSDDQNSMLAVTIEALEQWFADWEVAYKDCLYNSLRENMVPGEEGNCNILLKNPGFKTKEGVYTTDGWTITGTAPNFFNNFPLVAEVWSANFNASQTIELPVDGAYTLHTHGFYRCGNTDAAWQRWQAAGNQETQNLTGANSENTCRAYLFADKLTERFGNEFRNIYTRAQVEAMAAAFYTQDFLDTYLKKADETYYEKSGGGNLDEDFETCINANRTNPYDFSFNQIATADQVLNNSDLPALVPNAVYGAYAVFSSPEYADDYNMAINFLGRKGQIVKVGVKAENIQDYGWTIFQPFKLTWYGNDVARLQTVMQKVLDNAAALAAEPMQKDSLAALNAGMTAAQQAIAAEDVEALIAANDAINAAYGPAEQSANAYVPLVNKKAELDAAIVAYPNAQPEHMAVATALQSEVAAIIAGGTITSDQIPAKIEEMIVAIRNIDTTIITFADENVKALCVANWDINGDGELNLAEAAAVTDLGYVFKENQTITSFNELYNFTGLTSIGNYAFQNCFGLISVEVPNSVKSIGNSSFYQCFALRSIEIPNSVTSIGSNTFFNCHRLTSVEIPNSVTSIGSFAFDSCRGLTSITIPNTVTSIGSFAFSYCSGLISINVKEGNTKYDSRDNCNAIIETESNTLIAGCRNTTIPTSVTSIGAGAFADCANLTSIEIPNSVTTIGVWAFSYCSGLTSITIPNSVTSIGDRAFYGCSGLTSLIIPNSVTSMGDKAFSSCGGLTSINVEAGNTQYDSRDNCNAIIETESNTLIAGCKNTTIPNSVTSIGSFAFESCRGLTSITIPDGVTSIGSNAFDNCSALSMVTVEWEAPLAINYGTFSNLRNATLYVPKGSKAAYEAADYWKEFNAIKEYPNGDVNQDGEVDVVDVVDIARYVVGTPSESFEVFLADLNNDKDVNIADAVVLVNEIAGDVNFARAMAPSCIDTEESLILTQQEDNSLSLVLTNGREYTAFQFDLFVPANADVEQMLLNNQRKQRHQLLYNKVEEGHYRVTALSTSNRTFKGNGGELLSIMLNNVTSDIAVRNILFIDAMGNSYLFDDIGLSEGGATGISLTPSPSPTGEGSIYDLLGRKVGQRSEFGIQNSELKKGLYIINGKKVVIK